MQNFQELQTIIGQGIPAKIFLYNNSGYHSIRQTQQAYFDGHSVGCGPDSGVTFPDFGKVAQAFGFAYTRTSEHKDMVRAIADRSEERRVGKECVRRIDLGGSTLIKKKTRH